MTRLILPFLICALFSALVSAAPTLIDRIVAIVDEDIITQREMDERLELIRIEFAKSNRRLPETKVLNRQLMELMINESILLQKAASGGIKITDGQLNQAMQNIARDNQTTLSGFRERLIAQGLDYNKYRESVRKEMILTTLQRQYTTRTATISEAELDEFIDRNGDLDDIEYRISHILLSLPDAASPEQISAALESAKQVVQRLQQGSDFGQLASEFSSGAAALQGGDLGWRKRAEIPSLFSDSVPDMQVGEYAGPFRSPSGFHIVLLNDRRANDQVLTQQTRSRHILIRANELISDEDAQKKLTKLRQRIIDGEDFATLAKLHSVDYTSGAAGGDIGWMLPGATAEQYQAVTDTLALGEISEPFQSALGWHIAEVTGRRMLDETIEAKRKKIYAQLLQQKQREVFEIWQQRLRDEAYVIISDAS